jgi:hypothetical protein
MPNSKKEDWVNSIAPIAMQQWIIRISNAVVESCRAATISRAEQVGLGRAAALHRRASTPYQIRERIRCLAF